jgi:hypothetical protein
MGSISRNLCKFCRHGRLPVLLVAASASTCAQSSPQINSILESVVSDIAQTEQLAGMQMQGANIWLEDAELRLSTDNAADRKDGYELRLEPKTASQVESEKKLIDLYAQRRDTNYRLLLNTLLRDRYLVLVKLMKDKRSLESLLRRLQHAKEQVNYHKQQAHSADFQPDKLQQAIVDERQLSLLVKDKSSQLQRELTPYGITDSALIWDQWIQPAEILSLVEQYGVEGTSHNPALEKSLLKLQMARESRQRERAKKSFGVKLLRLEYQKDKDETMSVGIGFRIPLGGESFDAVERQFDVAEIQEEVRQTRVNLESSLQGRRLTMEKLKQDLGSQNLLLADISEQLDKAGQLPVAGLVLDLREQKDRVLTNVDNLQMQLVEEYIRFMYDRVLLSREPLRNWILTDQPTL